MRVWLLTVGEPLPIDSDHPRLHRCGLLAENLVKRGIEVVWWTSGYDHSAKSTRFAQSTPIEVNDRLKIWCLRSRPYRRNVSIARILANRDIAAEFRSKAPHEGQPDVLFASYPILELAEAGGDYARSRSIPAAVDVRDLWPDIWPTILPRPLQPAAHVALAPFYAQSRRVLRLFPSICGITEPMVDWGLQRANRIRSPWDRSFPLAYPRTLYAAAALEDARRFWSLRLASMPTAALTLCYFGTMSKRTRLDVVVDAIRLLPEKARAQTRVILCGTGENLDSLVKQAANLPQIFFPGWVNGPKIQILAELSNAGLLPYPSEPDFERSIPNKAIEYLAYGLPVLASLKGPVLNLISEEACGKTYRETDAVTLATTLLDLLERPQQLDDLSANATRTFGARFFADNVYGALGDLLFELTKDRVRLPTTRS